MNGNDSGLRRADAIVARDNDDLEKKNVLDFSI